LFRPLLKKKQVLPILLFVLSFSALFIFKVNIMLVMVSIVAFSIIQSLIVLQKEKRL
jgi:hypothetical protein